MSTKEMALETIRRLPASASWEEIAERIRFLAAVEKGRQDIREGKIVPHESVKSSLHEWISR